MAKKRKMKKVKAYTFETKIEGGQWVKSSVNPTGSFGNASRGAARLVNEMLEGGYGPIQVRVVRAGKVLMRDHLDD